MFLRRGSDGRQGYPQGASLHFPAECWKRAAFVSSKSGKTIGSILVLLAGWFLSSFPPGSWRGHFPSGVPVGRTGEGMRPRSSLPCILFPKDSTILVSGWPLHGLKRALERHGRASSSATNPHRVRKYRTHARPLKTALLSTLPPSNQRQPEHSPKHNELHPACCFDHVYRYGSFHGIAIIDSRAKRYALFCSKQPHYGASAICWFSGASVRY